MITHQLSHLPHRLFSRVLAAIVGGMGIFSTAAPAQSTCTAEPLAFQVLGSGGPFPAGRASSGYLVWRSGRAVALIDVGGGTFLRFGETGARLADLSLLAISHLHPDHSSDLPAFLWLSDRVRQQPLKLAGPSGAESYPSIGRFITRLFDSSSGAFPILSGSVRQTGTGVPLDIITVDATASAPTRVLADGDLEVTAIGVPHGSVPTVAYRLRVGERSIVFGSDQTGDDPRFTDFASGTDVLVMHLSLSQQAPDALARLHARPGAVGQVATNAKARRLVLSHLIRAVPPVPAEWHSLFDLGQAVADVKKNYSGPLDVASDLQCISIR
jgi:ribonuclease BN (tRNA processing enzyme)